MDDVNNHKRHVTRGRDEIDAGGGPGMETGEKFRMLLAQPTLPNGKLLGSTNLINALILEGPEPTGNDNSCNSGMGTFHVQEPFSHSCIVLRTRWVWSLDTLLAAAASAAWNNAVWV